jgi:molybdopterin converting factor small subunit
MQVKVKFMGHYKDLFGAEKDVELESGATLHDLAQAVCTSQECYQAIFDESGKPRPHVGIEEKKGRKLKLLHEGSAKLSDKDLIIFYHTISI